MFYFDLEKQKVKSIHPYLLFNKRYPLSSENIKLMGNDIGQFGQGDTQTMFLSFDYEPDNPKEALKVICFAKVFNSSDDKNLIHIED